MIRVLNTIISYYERQAFILSFLCLTRITSETNIDRCLQM